ncbi:hypothetical protein D9Q98_004355 [Chlorella vulgaris]|uniref:GH16 domain-containing protein n=1 Tax=Chlorella vulgaris TaxID=3077 RepID=A0A9D4YX17_CHLVU|nr:hypothetical protein D9Q98_004355 [Chlorella vulgaris]
MGNAAMSGRGKHRPVLLLLLVLAASSVLVAKAANCSAELEAAGAAGTGVTTEWIDAATPDTACTAQLCTDDFDTCNVASPPLSTLQLVFSDEFETEGQQLNVAAGNKRWTAEQLHYGATQDIEVYLPEQVTTEGGAAVITIDQVADGGSATALGQLAGGAVANVSSAYKSGFVDSWNKFCFTGGYLESRLQLPGNETVSGFWPALWLMGNLARGGYAETTRGFWPYSYSSCGGADVGAEFGAGGPALQNISACSDPPGFNRTKFGLEPGVGRGAPEIDLLEVMVGSSKRLKPGQAARPAKPGEQVYPHNLVTMQTAPLLPNGTTWTATDAAGKVVPGPGQYLPKDQLPNGMVTDLAWWKGPYTNSSDTPQTRPGSLYQDAVGAYASVNASFFTSFHTFGLHWVPREHVRWYIDGVLVYEVSQEALREQTNSTGYTVHERLIPVEPMAIIFNLAMSESFGYVDLEKLAFPSQYKVDYVRVYQNASAVNLGCSPPDFPTAQYLACNRDKYLLTEEDQSLVQGACMGAASCIQEAEVNFEGGDIPDGNGSALLPQQLATVKQCCQACQALPACGAYVYSTVQQMCYFKAPSGWTKVAAPDPGFGALAGVVYASGQTWPRGTNSSSGDSPAAAPQPASSSVGEAWQPPTNRSPPTASPRATAGSPSAPAPPPVPSSSGASVPGIQASAAALVALAVAMLLW